MPQRAIVVVALAWVALNSVTLRGQDLKDIGHFWAMSKVGGTVQFLPGGLVYKAEGGTGTFYSYHGGHFVRADESRLPRTAKNWHYFDWADIDYEDQIDRTTFDVPRSVVLPESSKVKKIIYVPSNNAPIVVVLICYSLPQPEEELPMPGANNIFLLALKGRRKDAGYSYEKLWTQKLQKGSQYGDIMMQHLGGVGNVLALYSSAPGGSSEDRQLDLYLLQNFPE